MQKLIKMKNKKGFTLIEMLIVILIIVILLAIAVPAVAGYRRDALRTQDEGAIETLRTAIEAATIRAKPIQNSGYSHVTGNLSYDQLIALSDTSSGSAHADEETREFYALLADYLGPNFQGGFKFDYRRVDSTGVSTNYLYWLTYWRSDPATDETIMFYHHHFANTYTEYREPEYLVDVIAKYPTLGGYYNFAQYRP